MTKVAIERFDHQGRGIGNIDKKLVFVENALPNEIVDVEIIEKNKNYDVAKVKKYVEKASNRVTPICPYYESCGGCHLQHLRYEDTLKYKKEKIENIFKQKKIVFPEITLVKNESPLNYRNKLSLKIIDGKLGFYKEKSHNLIDIKKCIIAKESINAFLKEAHKLKIKNGLLTIRSNYNDELLIVIDSNDKIAFNREDFPNIKIVGVVVNNKTIYGNNYFYERLNNCLFKVSYNAFFQVNPFITKELFTFIEKNVNEGDRVIDLYSGVGVLGIIASCKASEVYSIEIVKNAVLDNMENKKLNQRNNISVFLGSAERVLEKVGLDFNTIIVDPPRKGLDKSSLQMLLNSSVNKIIYISCDPMTLARDLKELTKKYELKKYYMLDMFSYTYHVESVCVLNRK